MTACTLTIEIDALTRETWLFRADIFSSSSTVILESYTRETRKSTRSKTWSCGPRNGSASRVTDLAIPAWWARTNSRDSTCERPIVSPEMVAKVREAR